MPTQAEFPAFESIDELQSVRSWLERVGVENVQQGHAHLRQLREGCNSADVLAFLGEQLSQRLPLVDDPDAALGGFAQFVTRSRSPIALSGMMRRDPELLSTVLQLLASGPTPAEILLDDPDSLELLRITDGQPIQRQILIDELSADVSRCVEIDHVSRLLRGFRQREMLRIVYGDIIHRASLARTAEQLSFVAEAILHAALLWTERELLKELPRPMRSGSHPARMVVIASGELGGRELSYGNVLNLLFVHDPPEASRGPVAEAAELFFQRWGEAIVDLLSSPQREGSEYQVAVSHLGSDDRLTADIRDALHYYDVKGLPWERMALVKARTVAGDAPLGKEFLEQLQPILFRRVLTSTDITGLRMLKRKIERQAAQAGDDRQNIRQGTGGIRDVEFVIEFLQLLSGSALPAIRVANTLQSIEALEKAGCLTMQERTTLSENYVMLRQVQHQLQIMHSLDCQSIPLDLRTRSRIARRLNFVDSTGRPDVEAFEAALRETQDVNRRVLDHLMHDAFGDNETVAVETELVLDPNPPAALVKATFEKAGFADYQAALAAMQRLADESIPFLSTPRCRHFLAAIAPKLLRQLSLTPDPPAALRTLVEVTDSLGGKGALWELLSTSESALQMVVRLCAGSPYLADILTSNPGMIDDLVDSLVLGRLPQAEELERSSLNLCRGAEDIQPILRSFKHASHLRIGIRDILGKADIRQTHAALAATADTCLRRAAEFEHQSLVQQFGDPVDAAGQPIHLMMLALGKLGAREPNYHSDLDVVFLYACDGHTQRRVGGRRTTITNADFFQQLTQRMFARFNARHRGEPLYELEMRIRPSGCEPSAVALPQFLNRYRYGTPSGEYWQRLALTKARMLSGTPAEQAAVHERLREVLAAVPWSEQDAARVRQIREQAQLSASPENLKRGVGGTLDVELLVSGLQLKHLAAHPEIMVPGTIASLEKLHDAGLIVAADAAKLIDGYRMLRQVESNLRLLNTTARHELPSDHALLAKLAYLIGDTSADQLVQQCHAARQRNRELFERLL